MARAGDQSSDMLRAASICYFASQADRADVQPTRPFDVRAPATAQLNMNWRANKSLANDFHWFTLSLILETGQSMA
jgi:hypothetical protein